MFFPIKITVCRKLLFDTTFTEVTVQAFHKEWVRIFSRSNKATDKEFFWSRGMD